MPKNTFILVVLLAIIASLLVGFNVGKKINQTPVAATIERTPIASPTPESIPVRPYTNSSCNVSLSYPQTMQVKESTRSALFSSGTDAVVLACQKDIPGIAISEDNKETIQIGSVSGTLYHTASPKDGTPINVFIITHPTTDMDILVSGMGNAFTTIIDSLTLQ